MGYFGNLVVRKLFGRQALGTYWAIKSPSRIFKSKPRRTSEHQGYYIPENPDKYSGDISDIFYKSKWEHKFCIFLDRSQKVKSWEYEPFDISYKRNQSRKTWYYVPDFKVVFKTGEVYLFEVKPGFQVNHPINQAKYDAATAYAKRRGWIFKVMTESELRKYGIMNVRLNC